MDEPPSRVVSQPEAKLTEDLSFVLGIGVMQDSRDVRELVHDGLDLGLSHAAGSRLRATLLLPKTSSMLVGADLWVWPMWPMLCAMATGRAFV